VVALGPFQILPDQGEPPPGVEVLIACDVCVLFLSEIYDQFYVCVETSARRPLWRRRRQ
jgi:hypothetical protein